MNRPRWMYLGLVGLAIVQTIYFYPQLPDMIASHYGAAGTANGWSSKEGFFIGYAAILALMIALFAGLPLLLARLPPSMINLPNKEYWLAEERKEQTMHMMSRQMTWFGIAVVAFLIVVFQLVISANLPGSAGFASTPFSIILGLFLLFVLVWTVWMLRMYRVPRA